MSANSKKRSFSQMLGQANVVSRPPAVAVREQTVTQEKWSDITGKVVKKRALVVHHQYGVAGTNLTGQVSLAYRHGDFKTNIVKASTGGYEIGKHNVSTSGVGSSARSFPTILGSMQGSGRGATDAMRVLKGTHITKGLTSTTKSARRAAVEMAGEIGVSEYSRGSNAALADAMINLYRVKHGNLPKADFADHELGYTGAGDGGAARLRKLGTIDSTFEPYQEPLRQIYDRHAAKKPNRPWEANVDTTGMLPKDAEDMHYNAWLVHKVTKWTGRK